MQELSTWTAQATEAARRAGDIIRQGFARGDTRIRYKGKFNPVTDVDVACQKLIREMLLVLNPEHAFLGEEDVGENALTADYLWIVDPLDGTKNFAHGYPHVAVSIALEVRGQVVVGVIYDPMRDELFSAYRGGGTYLNGKPVQVSEIEDLERGLLVTGLSGRAEVEYDIFLALERPCEGVRRDGSAALNLAYVACGRLDGFFQLNLNPWDVAAGSLLVQEAQGMVTDYEGSAFHCRNRQLVASNVSLHRPILDHIRPYLSEVQRRFPTGYR